MFEKKEVLKKLENVHYCFLPRVKNDDWNLVKKWKIDDDADFHWYKYLRKDGTIFYSYLCHAWYEGCGGGAEILLNFDGTPFEFGNEVFNIMEIW